jgi:hypothetical protein
MKIYTIQRMVTAPGLDRLAAPTMKQFEKGVFVSIELLQRMPLDLRHDPGEEPARQTRFNDSNQRAILFESD